MPFNNFKTLQIVPKLPPIVDGLGDYSMNLARALMDDHAIRSFFCVTSDAWPQRQNIGEFGCAKAPISGGRNDFERTLENILREKKGNRASVILHYENYSYAKRGCPFTLVGALKRLKKRFGFTLITLFHEVYATGPVWKSAFWLNPAQKKLSAEVISLSDHIFTPLQKHAEFIKKYSGGKKLFSLPNISNIPEPRNVPPLDTRTNRIVVFGRQRHDIYRSKKLMKALRKTAEMTGAKEISDVGAYIPLSPEMSRGLNIDRLGTLSASDLSRLLSGSRTGFIYYKPVYMPKSTVLSAYCAHGMVPVSACLPEDSEGLSHGVNYLSVGAVDSFPDISAQQVIADNAFKWYHTHDLAAHAAFFASAVMEGR